MHDWYHSIRVGFFLGVRQLFRSSVWMNVLIITVMWFTFLSLVGVPGILTGLMVGARVANKAEYTGNVIMTNYSKDTSIEKTNTIIETVESFPEVVAVIPRYLSPTVVEANYQNRRNFNEEGNSLAITTAGINPEVEDDLTNLSDNVVAGEYLSSDETGYLLIGTYFLENYSDFEDIFEPLYNVDIGDKIKLTYTGSDTVFSVEDPNIFSTGSGGRTREFIIKGVIESKVDYVTTRVFLNETDYRILTGRTSLDAQEIAILTDGSISDVDMKNRLIGYGFDRYAEIDTAAEAIPKFLDDIQAAMGMLGNIVGGVGVVVAAITTFVIIYINALVRRKYIGILKGIGVSRTSIKTAYVIQALFYAVVGIALGLFMIYVIAIPAINANPIQFPFSDGVLSAPPGSTATRALIMIVITILAGFIPAWLIVRKNTLDSILGR